MTDISGDNNGKLGLELNRKAGGIWFSSYWLIDETLQKDIAAGNIYVSTSDQYKSDNFIELFDDSNNPATYLSIYPNPSNGPVTFEFEAENDGMNTINIYSANGQIVQRAWAGYVKAGVTTRVNLERKLAKGLYFVELRSGDKQIISRLIVGNRYEH